MVASYHGGAWSIDAGRVHGIPAPTPGDSTILTLFAYNAAQGDFAVPARALARARVGTVLATTSQIEIIEGTADPSAGPLEAVILHLPAPRLRARLEGAADGVRAARKALADSLFIREPAEGEAADFRLIARGGGYLIARPDDDRPVVAQVDGLGDASARLAVGRLELIALEDDGRVGQSRDLHRGRRAPGRTKVSGTVIDILSRSPLIFTLWDDPCALPKAD